MLLVSGLSVLDILVCQDPRWKELSINPCRLSFVWGQHLGQFKFVKINSAFYSLHI